MDKTQRAKAKSGRNPPVSRTGVALPELQKQLVDRFGIRAPSLVTLKRMSADGRLADARLQAGEGKRARYDVDVAIKLIAHKLGYPVDKLPLNQASGDAVSAGAASAPAPLVDVDAIAERVAEILLEKIAVLGKLDAVLAAVGSLDSTRRSLMAKYDAHNDSLVQALAAARGDRSTSGGGLALDIARIQMALSRIEGALQRP